MRRWIVLAAIAAASCRQPMAVDTSGAEMIPTDVAVTKLREVLPTADVLGCTVPRAIFEGKEVKEWKIDEKGVEFGAPPKSYRFTFAEATSVRIERLGGSDYQVRIFTPAQPNPKKEHFYFTWKDEAKAKRAYELIESLRRKK
jgi:hypothetical protein